MPFTDTSADADSRANNLHPAGVAESGPVTFMDADHAATLAGNRVEIDFVDLQSFNADYTSMLATSAT